MYRSMLVVLVTVFLTGCVQNTAFRSEAEPYAWDLPNPAGDHEASDEDQKAFIELVNQGKKDAFSMVYIEFDDQGALLRPDLSEKALSHLEEHTKEPSLVVVFTHGWHHNAHFEDENVVSFRRLLSQLSESQGEDGLSVVGVFIGWRGESFSFPYLNSTTYWDRKESAHLVGFGATPVFVRIEDIVKNNGAKDANKLVTVGHSFGGAVTYTALAPLLQERYVRGRNGEEVIDGFGDLVVLLNPAFEAQWHIPLFNLTQGSCDEFRPNQPPRLLILAAEEDSDVGLKMQAAQVVASIGDSFAKGHITICEPSGQPVPWQTPQLRSEAMSPGVLGATVTHCLATKEDGSIKIKYKGTVMPNNPYMTFSADEGVIPDHNRVWEQGVIRVVTAAIEGRLTSEAYKESPLKPIEEGRVVNCPKEGHGSI